MEERSKKLVKNTAILGLGTICTKGIMFLMTPLFTRWLTQSDYGIFDLITTYITLIIPIITLSCGEAVFRLFLEKNEADKEKKIITNAIVIDAIGFIVASIITIIVSVIYSEIRNIAVYFLLLLIVEAINELLTMVLRGLKKLNIYTISNIIFVLSMVISVVILVKCFNLQLQGILLGYIIGYGISIIFMVKKSNVLQYISFKQVDKKVAKEMLSYSLPLMPNSLSWWIVNASDRTIVSVFLGTSSNAILAVAHKIPNLCQMLFNVFHLSWQESAVETIEDSDKDQYYTKVMNQMIMVLSSICIVIMGCNFLIFKFLFTEEYMMAYYQVPILVIAIIISMLAQFIGGIYVARKESYKNGKTTVIAAVTNIIIHFLLIRFIGIYAATVSTFIAYLTLFIIRYIDIKKIINIKFYKSSLGNFAIFIYYFICIYINNLVLHCINLVLAIVYFMIVNKQIVIKVSKKLLAK